MKYLRFIIFPVFALLSCQKDISITEFSEFYSQYEPEIKVEAFLNSSYPMSSTVVIDRSIRVDDTEIFNGLDDDGDWVGYSDDNGNGRWDYGEDLNDDLGEDGIAGVPNGFPAIDDGEGNGVPDQGEPHVDESDEISILIADSTAEVTVTHVNSGTVFPFIWVTEADSFQYTFWNDEENLLPDSFTVEHYGAYKPAAPFTMDPESEYELNVVSSLYNTTLSARTKPVSEVKLLNPDFSIQQGDTVFFTYGEDNYLYWLSGLDATTYYVTVYQHLEEGKIFLSEGPSFRLENLEFIPDSAMGFTFFPPLVTEGVYDLEIWGMNPDLGRYYYSSLGPADPAVTNLRDSEGEPVTGIFGTYSVIRKTVVVQASENF